MDLPQPNSSATSCSDQTRHWKRPVQVRPITQSTAGEQELTLLGQDVEFARIVRPHVRLDSMLQQFHVDSPLYYLRGALWILRNVSQDPVDSSCLRGPQFEPQSYSSRRRQVRPVGFVPFAVLWIAFQMETP